MTVKPLLFLSFCCVCKRSTTALIPLLCLCIVYVCAHAALCLTRRSLQVKAPKQKKKKRGEGESPLSHRCSLAKQAGRRVAKAG